MKHARGELRESWAKRKSAYWSVVKDCLVAFHHVPKGQARSKASGFRKTIENPPEGICGDIIYHDEPFYVACDIAGVHDVERQGSLFYDHAKEYQTIKEKWQW